MTQNRELNKTLENIAWGLFLVMIGGMWLAPEDVVPEGTWLIGVGLIMIGLNAARHLKGIKTSTFTVFLGTLALVVGLADFAGIDLPLLPILLIIIGAHIIYGAVANR